MCVYVLRKQQKISEWLAQTIVENRNKVDVRILFVFFRIRIEPKNHFYDLSWPVANEAIACAFSDKQREKNIYSHTIHSPSSHEFIPPRDHPHNIDTVNNKQSIFSRFFFGCCALFTQSAADTTTSKNIFTFGI